MHKEYQLTEKHCASRSSYKDRSKKHTPIAPLRHLHDLLAPALMKPLLCFRPLLYIINPLGPPPQQAPACPHSQASGPAPGARATSSGPSHDVSQVWQKQHVLQPQRTPQGHAPCLKRVNGRGLPPSEAFSGRQQNAGCDKRSCCWETANRERPVAGRAVLTAGVWRQHITRQMSVLPPCFATPTADHKGPRMVGSGTASPTMSPEWLELPRQNHVSLASHCFQG